MSLTKDLMIIGQANELDMQNNAAAEARGRELIRDTEVHNQGAIMRQQQGMLDQANVNNGNLAVENERLRKENEYYKSLLSKPMAEIANQNSAFKETYLKQQELLKQWMLSQQAFKSLSSKFADKLGLTKEERKQSYDQAIEKTISENSELNESKDKLSKD
ncbi:hypothetical protein LA345_13985 [Burkholderia vietnamiensis]|nr:hypothetical protein [Burkholderia vietnamiensis]